MNQQETTVDQVKRLAFQMSISRTCLDKTDVCSARRQQLACLPHLLAAKVYADHFSFRSHQFTKELRNHPDATAKIGHSHPSFYPCSLKHAATSGLVNRMQ